MKTAIVNEAVRGQSIALALKSGAYTVAGTGLCGLGSVLDTAADIGQKVVDATRAAGEACTAKGEEFLAEAAALKGEQPAKKEEKKAEKKAAPQKAQSAAAPAAKATANKAWTLADFVAQHNEFAAAATAICKEFTKVMFRAEGSVKGVVTAFDAVRRADGAHCTVLADMAEKTFSVVATPVKKEKKPVKKAAKKAAAPKQGKASKKAAPVKETVKAEPAKTEEAKEVADMKAALEAARAKKAAAKAKTVKVEAKAEAAPKQEKASEKAPVKETVKKAEGKKESYSSNPKADMALEEAVHDHGEWLDKVIRHFQTVSTKALTNVVVKSNYLKFSSYGENGQDNAVSVAFKSHTVKVNRKVVKLDL